MLIKKPDAFCFDFLKQLLKNASLKEYAKNIDFYVSASIFSTNNYKKKIKKFLNDIQTIRNLFTA